MKKINIPFNKLHLTGNEMVYIQHTLGIGSVAGDGYYTNKVCSFLEERLNNSKVYTMTSGTHALEMAMLLFQISTGDEVIMPSYTFPSTANAVLLHGGTPVFVDIDCDALTMNLEQVESKITKNTKGILPVHYGGIGCKMDELMKLAQKYDLFVVEDAAQALGATYKGKPLGTWGDVGCFSFHGTKNYVSGEGGALCINIKEPSLLKRAEQIRQKGTNRNQFIRGEVSQYTWMDVGSSYAPSDILMAMLYSQLENMDDITQKRKRIVENYSYHLQKFKDKKIIQSMTNIPEDFQSNYHNFYIVLENPQWRNLVIERLKDASIQAYIHFVPLHSSPMGSSLGYSTSDLPNTQMISDSLLRLPLYTDMDEDEFSYIITNLCDILEGLF